MALLSQQRSSVLLELLPTHHIAERHGLLGSHEPNPDVPAIRARCGVDVWDCMGRGSLSKERANHHLQLCLGSDRHLHDGIRVECASEVRRRISGRVRCKCECAEHIELHAQQYRRPNKEINRKCVADRRWRLWRDCSVEHLPTAGCAEVHVCSFCLQLCEIVGNVFLVQRWLWSLERRFLASSTS